MHSVWYPTTTTISQSLIFGCSEPQDSTVTFQNRSVTERNQIRIAGVAYKRLTAVCWM